MSEQFLGGTSAQYRLFSASLAHQQSYSMLVVWCFLSEKFVCTCFAKLEIGIKSCQYCGHLCN